MGNKSSKTAGGDSAADKSKEEVKKDKSQVVATAGTSSPAPAALVAATGDKTGDNKKMLVALDHSEQSLLAVRWILDNFVNTGDDVTLVTAFEAFKPKPRVPMIQEPLTEVEIQKIKEEADKKSQTAGEFLLESMGRDFEAKGIKPRTIVIKTEESPKEALVKLTESEAFTVACVASRGHGALKRTILGSTSDYLMHHANCPVFIIKFD